MTEFVGEEVDFDPFTATPLSRVVLSTSAQREVWLADRLSREASLAFNESISLRLQGRLDVQALERAISNLMARHEALRSAFSSDGLQMLVRASSTFQLSIENLTEESEDRQQQELEGGIGKQVTEPFDLEKGPLLRAVVFLMSAERSVLVLTSHHIVCDGWSFGVLVKEVLQIYAAYAGAAEPSLPRAYQYGDYATDLLTPEWQSAAQASLKYWVSHYDRGAPVLELPVDRVRPPSRGFASRRVELLLDADLVVALRKLSARSGVSLFSTLLGSFGALIGRLSDSASVVVGVPAAAQAAHDHERLVGHCVNLLPIEIQTSKTATAKETLAATHRAVLDAYEHQACSFGDIVAHLQIERDPGRLPLVSVEFNLDSRLVPADLTVAGLNASVSSNARAFENFELFVNAAQSEDGIVLECQYSADLFEVVTIRSWLELYREALARIVSAPDARWAELLAANEAQVAQLARWNDTKVVRDQEMTVAGLLESAAGRTPDGEALVCEGMRLTYRELMARANRLAHVLRERGAGRGKLLGLCLERGIDLIVAQLAVLKSGAGYVPLDPTYPSERLSYMAEDAKLTLLVTHSALAATLPWPRETSLWVDVEAPAIAARSDSSIPEDPLLDAMAGSPAYVIYTSGSTGRPKGVVVPNGAVVNFLLGTRQRPGMSSNDRLVAVTTLSFDIAVLELLLPIASGAQVMLATREQCLDGALLRKLIDSSGATSMQATPATWRMLLEAGWRGGHGFRAFVGGEALPADLADALLGHVDELWNMYGPTETTVWSTCSRVVKSERIAIGTPLANQAVYVLDEERRQCPIGVPGELWIGGQGVTSGYLNQPALTAERFLPDPFSSEANSRMYRTGDRGRWTWGGQLEHQGRLDNQVKVRGFRIELGEIETQLARHSRIEECVVAVREDLPGDSRIVAYCVSRGEDIDVRHLREHLGKTLPTYMLPQHFVRLAALPRLPNGKLDRMRLPAPSAGDRNRAPESKPATPLEAAVVGQMCLVLRLPHVGLDENFFTMGGHSLLAMQLAMGLREKLNIEVPLRVVFEEPTAKRLAGWIASLSNVQASDQGLDSGADQSTAPATLMQQRIWFMENLYPGRSVYNTPSAHRLTGPFSVDALQLAVEQIVSRQSTLRTWFEDEQGVPMQCVATRMEVVWPAVEDLSDLPQVDRESRLQDRLKELASQPIDICEPPLFRVRMFRMRDDEHVFFFMPHHIIWDGWSFDLFYEEMATLYGKHAAAEVSQLAELRFSYGDFANWHAKWVAGPEVRRQLDWWRNQLTPMPPPLDVAADSPRPALMSGSGDTVWLRLDGNEVARAREVALAGEATLFMFLLACYAALLSRISGQNDIVIGTPVRGRNTTDTEKLMGLFVNVLPIRLRIPSDATFAELLRLVRSEVLSSFGVQDVPIEQLVRELKVPRDESRSPVYQAFFSMQDARRRTRKWGDLRQDNVPIMQGGTAEDLGLWFLEQEEGLTGGLTFNTDILRHESATKIASRFKLAVARALADAGARLADLVPDGIEAERLTQQFEQPSITAQVAVRPAEATTETERMLLSVWQEALGVDDVSPRDLFFDVGGHSLLVMQVISRMEKLTGKRIGPRHYFNENLSQIARAYDQAGVPVPGSGSVKRGILNRLLGRSSSGN